MNHSYKEVRIPISWGTLAGKLWQSQYSSTTNRLGVLMLHGFLDNAGSFDTLIEYFPKHLTLLAIDLPGHGFSDHYAVKNAYQYFSFVSDVIEVLKYLSWEQTILIGHSFGGTIAINVAAILQNRIRKLIVLDGSYPPDYSYERFSNYLLGKYEDNNSESSQNEKVYPSRAKVVERILEGNPDINQSSAEILATRACREEKGGFVLTRDIGIPKLLLVFVRHCFWDLFSQVVYDRITMPALFIIIEKSYVKIDEIIEIKKVNASPTNRVVHVKGSHRVHMDDPEVVGRLIRAFLDEKIVSKL